MISELFLYDRDDSVFKNITMQIPVINGNYFVCPNYGHELNADNLDQYIKDVNTGTKVVKPKYPICACMTPKSNPIMLNGFMWELFYFEIFFLQQTYLTPDNKIKNRDIDTNTSTHHVWYDWAEMKDAAMSFVNIFMATLKGTVTVGDEALPFRTVVNVDFEKLEIRRLSNFLNDKLSGVSIKFKAYLNINACDITSDDGINYVISTLNPETDPIWESEKNNYYNKSDIDVLLNCCAPIVLNAKSDVIIEEDIITKFGAQILGQGMTTSNKISVLNSLGVQETRLAFVINDWTSGSNHSAYDSFVSAGKRPIPNINWNEQNLGVFPFVTDLVEYETRLNSLLDTILPVYTPDYFVIENEPFNGNYHSGSISNYISELQKASEVIRGRGLKLCDGGIYGNVFHIIVYRYLKDTYGQTFAEDNYGLNVFSPGTLSVANGTTLNPSIEASVSDMMIYLDACSIYCDALNYHHYEPADPNLTESDQLTVTPNMIKYAKEFSETILGIPLISNETSTRNNTHGELVSALMQDWIDNEISHVIWMDNVPGNSDGGTPLENKTTFELLETGEAYRNIAISL